MTRRARLLAVVASLAAGALGIVSSTQVWLNVTLNEGSGETLPVPGAAAVALLAPLSMAVLALAAALSLVGFVLRAVFGALCIAIGATLVVLTWQAAVDPPVSAVASTVTEATGIAGPGAVAALVATISVTPWPFATLAGWVLLVGVGAFTLTTARSWSRTGRRYAPAATASERGARDTAIDPIDSWDDLSRGDDPTR